MTITPTQRHFQGECWIERQILFSMSSLLLMRLNFWLSLLSMYHANPCLPCMCGVHAPIMSCEGAKIMYFPPSINYEVSVSSLAFFNFSKEIIIYNVLPILFFRYQAVYKRFISFAPALKDSPFPILNNFPNYYTLKSGKMICWNVILCGSG